MSSSSEILVVILATALAIFLALAIVLAVLLIKITRQIHAITNSARLAVDNMQGLVATISKAAAPAVTSKFIIDQLQRFAEHIKKAKKGD